MAAEPKSVWIGTLQIGSITIRTAVLDDGTRVLDVGDVERLFEAMGDPSFRMTDDEARQFAEFCRKGDR